MAHLLLLVDLPHLLQAIAALLLTGLLPGVLLAARAIGDRPGLTLNLARAGACRGEDLPPMRAVAYDSFGGPIAVRELPRDFVGELASLDAVCLPVSALRPEKLEAVRRWLRRGGGRPCRSCGRTSSCPTSGATCRRASTRLAAVSTTRWSWRRPASTGSVWISVS